ncbi:MAG: flippase [Pedosphaera sp.]|nr:flippase [Pedosphaera sp.]
MISGSQSAGWNRLLLVLDRLLPGGNQVLANASWLVLDKMFRLGVGLFVGAWVSRHLGPKNFGLLAFTTSFAAMFVGLGALASENVVVRDLSRYPDQRDRILGTAFILRLAGTFAAGLLAVAIAWSRYPDDFLRRLCIALALAGSFIQVSDAMDLCFQSRLLSKYTTIAKNAAFLLTAVLRIILIRAGAPIQAFALAGLCEIGLGALLLWVAYRQQGNSIRSWRWDAAWAARLWKDSWPLLLSGTMILIYMRIDQVMLGELSNDQELGVYAVAVRYAEVWYFIPIALQSSVLPGIVQLAGDPAKMDQRLQHLYNLMAFITYAVALPVTFLSAWIIGLLNGPKFLAAAPMLSILVWSGMFVSLGVARGVYLTSMNWPKIQMAFTLVGCLTNIILNFLWIPRYGGMGAVWATCISYGVQAYLSCFLYRPLWKTGWMLTRALLYPKPW